MKIIFNGECNDAEIAISLKEIMLSIDVEGSHFTAKLSLNLRGGVFVAACDFSKNIDIYTARNLIIDFMYKHTSFISFYFGKLIHYTVNSAVVKGSIHIYENFIPVVTNDKRSKRIRDFFGEDFINAQNELMVQHPSLSNIFSMINNAFRDPVFTGFYCYIAIEAACKNHCGVVEKISPQDWSKFRQDLNINKNVLDYIKESADPARHGSPVGVSDKNRAKIFSLSIDVLDRFVFRKIDDAIRFDEEMNISSD